MTKERLKVLISLDQKVSSRLILFDVGLHGHSAAGRRAGSNPGVSCFIRNLVSPYLSLIAEGKPTARKAEGDEGMRWWKKRTLPCNGVDRD